MLCFVPKDVLRLIYRFLYSEVIKQYKLVWLNSKKATHKQLNNDQMYWDNKYCCFKNRNGFHVANYRGISYVQHRNEYYALNTWKIKRLYDYKKDLRVTVPPRYVYSGFTKQSIISRVHVAIIILWNYFSRN